MLFFYASPDLIVITVRKRKVGVKNIADGVGAVSREVVDEEEVASVFGARKIE